MDTVGTVDTEAMVTGAMVTGAIVTGAIVTGAMEAMAIQFTEASTVLITERDMVALDIKVYK
jgi:uncharacterized protein YejL (UPF0352 family)